jgi:hypothetical protein
MNRLFFMRATSGTGDHLWRLVSVICLLAMPVKQLSAVELYKYRNADGNFEVSNAVPANLASKGYTVVNTQGQILRVIAPQMTAAELQKKAALDKLNEEKLAVIKWEDELMLRYSSPADVEYARDQKTRAIETMVASTLLNIDRLKVQKRQLENQAANMERAGQALTPQLLRNLDIVEEQIQGRLEEVAARKAEQAETLEEFERIIVKIRELYGIPEPMSADLSVNMDVSKTDH